MEEVRSEAVSTFITRLIEKKKEKPLFGANVELLAAPLC